MTGEQSGQPAGVPIRGDGPLTGSLTGKPKGKQPAGVPKGRDGQVTGTPRRRNEAAGIWTIVDVKTGEIISRFRARRRADIDRYLKMAEIGLRRPASDFEAVFVTDWDGD